jgi:hypothetical protein
VKSHQITIFATNRDTTREGWLTLQIKCSCGAFLADREGTYAEMSLMEITDMVTMHYLQAAHPEKGNGLLRGKK